MIPRSISARAAVREKRSAPWRIPCRGFPGWSGRPPPFVEPARGFQGIDRGTEHPIQLQGDHGLDLPRCGEFQDPLHPGSLGNFKLAVVAVLGDVLGKGGARGSIPRRKYPWRGDYRAWNQKNDLSRECRSAGEAPPRTRERVIAPWQIVLGFSGKTRFED